jgi:serine/threonine-protein kinase
MSDAEAASPVHEGDIIAEKYRVERVLGVGGMGVVVAALHLELDERVALKFLLPEGVANAQVAARFAQEARAAAKIKSEHVARVIDVGRTPTGVPYMVMEYLDGEDLERVLEARGPLPVDVAVAYVLEASQAIAEAHSLGIVHRDLKPANLFLARRPNGPAIVKVLDFGISKTITPGQPQLTKTSAMLGSPLYMSPEQMSAGKTVDARADVWGLGVVLYHLVSGQRPFPGDTMPALVASILQSPPLPLEPIGVNVPPAFLSVMLRCLEKDPARRFPNVYELALALAGFAPATSAVSVQRIAHVLSVAPQETPLAQSPVEPSTPEPPPNAKPTSNTVDVVTGDSIAQRPLASRRTPVVGVLAAVAVVAAVGIAFVMGGKTRAAVATSAPAGAAPVPTAAPPVPTAADDPSPPPMPPPTATSEVTPPPTGVPASAATAASEPSAAPRPPSRPRSHTPGPAKAAPVDCDPPYVIDSVGHRQYKPECIQ